MVIHYTHAVNATRQALERRCPKCAHAQIVPVSRKSEPVPCEVCSAAIPPPAAATK